MIVPFTVYWLLNTKFNVPSSITSKIRKQPLQHVNCILVPEEKKFSLCRHVSCNSHNTAPFSWCQHFSYLVIHMILQTKLLTCRVVNRRRWWCICSSITTSYFHKHKQKRVDLVWNKTFLKWSVDIIVKLKRNFIMFPINTVQTEFWIWQ